MKVEKMESPIRLEELRPAETLIRIGLRQNHTLCDIGAGSGVFNVTAAMITYNKVYALEIDQQMLKIIEKKAQEFDLPNIVPLHVDSDDLDIEEHSVDIALMVTVLHELPNKSAYLTNLKRFLSEQARIGIIEFHKKQTPLGPPVEHRLSKVEIKDLFAGIGFAAIDNFDLGENFYCLVFTAENK